MLASPTPVSDRQGALAKSEFLAQSQHKNLEKGLHESDLKKTPQDFVSQQQLITVVQLSAKVPMSYSSGVTHSTATRPQRLRKHLLWLDAVKNLLKCNGSVFDTIKVHKHQETCEKESKKNL